MPTTSPLIPGKLYVLTRRLYDTEGYPWKKGTVLLFLEELLEEEKFANGKMVIFTGLITERPVRFRHIEDISVPLEQFRDFFERLPTG